MIITKKAVDDHLAFLVDKIARGDDIDRYMVYGSIATLRMLDLISDEEREHLLISVEERVIERTRK